MTAMQLRTNAHDGEGWSSRPYKGGRAASRSDYPRDTR